MDTTRERPLLILDLDETLVWATREASEAPHDFRVFGYYVTKRPHLQTFLDRVFSWFDVAVWTSSGEHYASAVVTVIFENPSRLLFVWCASRCTERIDRETGEQYNLKDLKKVKRKGFPLERMLVIDDSPEKIGRQYGNHLRLHPFEGDTKDRELLDVLPFLDWIRTQDDFRRIEKRTWRTRKLV
jgi:RNA polymerase II subunit A small phosphatase-like protein